MKKFILKIIATSLLVGVLINVLLFYAASENHFIKGITLKHERLEQTASPRIVLVGGSGISYSVDSELLSQQTGLPVVNMGLFAQFGLRYMLEEVKQDIRKDDVIFIIPEYHLFYYFFEGWRGFNELIYVYPKALLHVTSTEQIKIIIKAFPRFFKKKIQTLAKSLKTKIWHRTNKTSLYNEYGDYVDHLDSEEKFEIEKLPLFDSFVDTSTLKLNQEAIPVLNDFYQQMTKKGAAVYLLYPTIPDQQFVNYQTFIKKIETALNANAQFERLNEPQNETQPNEDFYNTVYHLNKKGREKRTLRLINTVKGRY